MELKTRRSRAFAQIIIVALLGWCTSGVVYANTDRALRRLYRKSGRHVKRGQYTQAEVNLQTAITLLKRTLAQPRLSEPARKKYQKGLFRFSIALAVTYYQFMKKPLKAYHVLETLTRQKMTPSQRKLYRRHLARIAPKVKTSLVLRTTPINTTLRLSHPAGWQHKLRAPLRKSLWPGRWTITITAPGYQNYRLYLQLRPGSFLTRSIRLLQVNATVRARVALFSTPPRAQVELSHPRLGRCRGQTPLYLWMGPGTWQVKATSPQHRAFQGKLQVAPQDALQRTLVLEPKNKPLKRILAWSGLGLAVLAGGTAAILTQVAQSEFSEITTLQRLDQQTEFNERFQAAANTQIAAYVLFGLAGASLLASGGVFAHLLLSPSTNIHQATNPPRPWRTLRPCQANAAIASKRP